MVGERAHFNRSGMNNSQGVTGNGKRRGPRSPEQDEFAKDLAPGADPPLTLYVHCLNTYNKMFENSRRVTSTEGSPIADDQYDDSMIVYEGMLTHLIIQDLGLSTPYYTKVTRALKGMGCIRQLSRGGGTAKSQWELMRTPTEALFNQAMPPKVKVDKYAMLEGQIATLSSRISELEEVLHNITRREGVPV